MSVRPSISLSVPFYSIVDALEVYAASIAYFLTLLSNGRHNVGRWTEGCIGGGYTRVYGVYQPPGFFMTAYTHLSDHR